MGHALADMDIGVRVAKVYKSKGVDMCLLERAGPTSDLNRQLQKQSNSEIFTEANNSFIPYTPQI